MAVGILWILIGVASAQGALGLLVLFFGSSSKADALGIGMFAAGASLSVMTAVVGVAAGVGLLRLQRWSRVALEVLTWIYCVICLAAAVFGAYAFVTWPTPSDRWVPVVSMVTFPFALVFFGVILWALRSRKMRAAFPITA